VLHSANTFIFDFRLKRHYTLDGKKRFMIYSTAFTLSEQCVSKEA